MTSQPGNMTDFALVGDVGGTNVRLGLVALSSPAARVENVRHYASGQLPSLEAAIRSYRQETATNPRLAVIAVAGPIENGTVHFTNLAWSVSESNLVHLGFEAARLINDFAALALATVALTQSDSQLIGPPAKGDPAKTVAVVGPGTGFGASALVRGHGGEVVMATEGGHVSFAPVDEVEMDVLRLLARRFGHVSVERILSGPGLCNLHAALNELERRPDDISDPSEITRLALTGDPSCLRTVDRFGAILGSVAGNFALSYGAEGGVYVAGGIAPAVIGLLEKSPFRERFEAKGRFRKYLSAIPTRVIMRDDAAFLGASRVARELSKKSD
jgi:glucokinase